MMLDMLIEESLTSPPFDGINLNSGDMMREDWFPKIYNS